ncbi:hypothetical protein DQ400_19550 [Vreelandella sulfidaeris]|jgi:hypothetical protein|uniref:Uncharacterized protein n=1 Tax=Vreelandella sulfidaeris TaxID=115553 RepID=A0A365TKQ2_9GAMM|nr:hypothetical protein [Halomonas sulfidaeris]RBI65084.1 hypothetical protein DQ400_19550 [Halomonas sulfidaeris]
MVDQQKRGKRLQKNPLSKLKDSVQYYDQPFDPVGIEDWEAALLDDLTPETAHADSLATPTAKELGNDIDNKP